MQQKTALFYSISSVPEGSRISAVESYPPDVCTRSPSYRIALVLHNHINGRNGKCGFGQVINGRIVFPLYHILIVLSVVVSIRPRFPFQKFFLAGKVLASQADDDFIGIHINDGIGVFLIQRIDAFSIKCLLIKLVSENISRQNTAVSVQM